MTKQLNRSRRFKSLKSAKSFAKSLGVKVQDLRNNKIRKSDFKVTYSKEQGQNRIIKY